MVLGWGAALARFIYKFVVGDDLAVAIVMLAALALSAVLIRDGVDAWWLVPPVAVGMTGVSLIRAGRLSISSPVRK